MPVRYVVVIPVFRHSVLIVDSLRSLLAQDAANEMTVIVVDDGCPHPETAETLAFFQASYPNHIAVYRQKNRGLSGARNTGIEIALRNHPEAYGIYFLDADNVLESWALKRVGDACAKYPQADWFFPDIANFGVRWLSDYQGAFDTLELLEHNYCEAGSFVRMRVFKAGVRFDETMKLGYEDWDFWLQATAKCFRGQHLPDAGFRYRKRGESMLSDSDRDRSEILGYIKRKHRKHFSPKRILDFEVSERPRSLFVDVERRDAILGLDYFSAQLNNSGQVGLEELAARLASYPEGRLGSQAFFGTARIWEALARARLLHWVTWECERLQYSANIVMVRLVLTSESDHVKICDEPFHPKEGQLFYMSTRLLSDCANDDSGSWFASLAAPHPQPSVRCLSIHISRADINATEIGEAPILSDTVSFIEILRRRRRTFADCSSWQRDANMRLGSCRPLQVGYDWHQLTCLFPRRGMRHEINIGFVLPLAAFGGVERVAHQTALALRSMGMIPHLIIVGPNEFSLPAEFGGIYETVRLFREERYGAFGWADNTYFYGTNLPELQHSRVAELAGLCSDLDVVINGHSGPINFALASLRRCGVITASSQHVFDVGGLGRPTGHPFISLAFEHAYDAILPVSEQMMRQMHGLGVPHDKLIHVQNAGGFKIEDHDVEQALASREDRQGPLRCLFMGRLDPQKGGDRLMLIAELAKAENLSIDWRIIGKSVISDGAEALKLEGVAIEPPVLRGRDIAERLAWADVVLLPSRYEGLPLLVHEAMSFGAITIASDVGAIKELIVDEDTGYIVPQDSVVDSTLAILRKLQERPSAMRAMGRRASAFARARSWVENAKPLAHWIRGEHARRQQL